MDIQTIYRRLKQSGLATSQVQFSQVWLGRSKRYYSYLVATRREPGLATMTALHWRLAAAAGTDIGGSSSARELADELRKHIDHRAIIDIRRRVQLSSATHA